METPGQKGSVAKRPLRKKAGLRNYDENLMDELIESHLGGSLKKKFRTREELEKETETEAMLALSLGFPIDALLEDEIKAGVVRELGGKEQNDYIVVRNHILARWRSNVKVWLLKGQVKETVSNEYEHLLSAAYDFLLYNGYINFGLLTSLAPPMPELTNERSVIIVGAGLAGLSAAKQLMSFGFKVIVLEGRNRPGGRVYTQKMGNEGQFAAVDLGGSVITGIHANPLGVLARQLSIPLHKVRDNCPLYGTDGAPVDREVDLKIEFIFNKLLDKVMELRKTMGGFGNDISLSSVLERLRQLYNVARTKEEKQLLDWHFANLEYANAGCLSNLSATYWDQDDPYEMGGDHCLLAGGNWRLINALCEGVPIFYGKTVNTIKYGSEGVKVIAGEQAFEADMVLCTVPLGVLKKKIINFDPELPTNKLAAIDRLGFGMLNKVAMVFPHVFWGEELDTFGCLNENSNKRGEFFLFYGNHTVSGGAVLIALVAGEAAQMFEDTDPCTVLHRVLSILRGIYKPKGIDVPDPVQTICTKWGSDPFSYGSYSHVRVQSSGSDYDLLAETVGERLFFAGEATTRQYPATMHGAFLSGLREASRILKVSKNWQNNLRKSIPRNVGVSNDALLDLFKRPEVEFGNFSLVYNPFTEDPKSMAILRVTFDNCEDDLKKQLANGFENHLNLPLQLYAVLNRDHALKLQEMAGSDKEKVWYLIKVMGLKLMGHSAVVNASGVLISSIVTARRGRGKKIIAGQHSSA
ncbi:lysine-specific histone demethylase 1 homolog 2 [Mercurialis annua]|uniref:lysine-specific histone demethylase 1 homolog 2 n=1 Tax=Mercurialis annua TaxID=3986 RepID=UPI00215E5E17|nr:lysine-specific histone demethylase 1 homolog 2 [Mercurialis annua]